MTNKKEFNMLLVFVVCCISTIHSTCVKEGYLLHCFNVTNEKEFSKGLERNRDPDLVEFALTDSELRYISHDAFHGTNFTAVYLWNISLLSLSDTDIAFEGLEDTLKTFIVHECSFVGHWNWDSIRNFRALELIDVADTDMEYVSDFPNFSRGKNHLISIRNSSVVELSPTAFSQVEDLVILLLALNNIEDVERSMFPKPALNLTVLGLSNNTIKSLPVDIFTDMPALKEVKLDGNKIHTIEKNVFVPVRNHINLVRLLGNDLNCDCRLKWIIEDDMRTKLLANCKYPPDLEGREVSTLDYGDLWC
uniref:Leucine-rich repeat domain-containing protein n=1 Tax=Physocyclus mexicanus TaxID=1705800 RepID=A0A6B9KE55_9ARAC|nr:leucine-rich repeat domain-containing protein [Physocyclus mexicanus]